MLSEGRRRLLASLAAAPLAASLAGCGIVARSRTAPDDTPAGARLAATRLAKLEHQWARTAWRYIENNTDYDSGLVAGSDRGGTFTAWNAGDTIAALVAARELEIIDAREFDLRLGRVLGFLATMDLSKGMLPNKAYSVTSGKMVNFGNREEDIGWSAVDVGRLLLWLRITGQRHPAFREYTDRVVLRWSFCEVLDDCGVLYGTQRNGAQWQRYQEGRLGYEQLAGAGYAAWGFNARRSVELPPMQQANIHGIAVHYDARDPRTSGAQNPVLTMPWALLGMEVGWQVPTQGAAWKEIADEVMRVQEERWRREKLLTARSDYQMREAPYVVLDSVFAAGYAWNTIGSDGKEYEKLALVATRAAFAMWALWPGDYSQRLVDSVQRLYDPDRGWFEGRFEAGGAPHANLTLNTNAAVLEALLFKVTGSFYTLETTPGHFELRTRDTFARMNRCWPAERGACTAAR